MKDFLLSRFDPAARSWSSRDREQFCESAQLFIRQVTQLTPMKPGNRGIEGAQQLEPGSGDAGRDKSPITAIAVPLDQRSLLETIQQTGYDAWVEFTWDTVPRFLMSLRTDLTTYPSDKDGLAVIPSFNAKWLMTKNAYVGASIGYGTRFRYQHGGVNAGANVGYQF